MFCYSANSQEYTPDSMATGKDNLFKNTNIGKLSFCLYGGVDYMIYTKHLSAYFRSSIGGIMSLDIYNIWENLSVSVSLMGDRGIVKKDIVINTINT